MSQTEPLEIDNMLGMSDFASCDAKGSIAFFLVCVFH